MKLRRLPRPTSVFTGIVMICLYLPIIAVIVYSLDKSADLIGLHADSRPTGTRSPSTTPRCAVTC